MPRNVAEKSGAALIAIAVLAVVTRPLLWALHCLLGRPRDSILAIMVASAVGAIAINGLFLQHGRHPAPIFAQRWPQPVADVHDGAPAPQALARSKEPQPAMSRQASPADTEATGAVVAVLPRERPPGAPPRPQQVATRSPRRDAIAEILASSQQLSAIQRALSDYGYGQIQPNGTLGPDTRAAIERFERERNLPVTGQVSDRLVRELATATGRDL